MGRLFAPREKPAPAEEPKRVEAPPPSGLSKDDVKNLLEGALGGVADRLGTAVTQLNERIDALATRTPQVIVQAPTAPAGPTEISDTEIDTAVLSGQGAAQRIRQLVDRAVNAATDRIIKERVQPLEEFGVRTLGDLTQRTVTSGMKHYGKYKKEIDEQLATLNPAARSNPLVIETIYNAVVGRHADELANEAAEAAVRQAQEQANATGQDPSARGSAKPVAGRAATPGTGAGPGAARDADEVPDLQAYLGSGETAGREALQHKGAGGQDQDAFARSMGYKDWSSYMKQYQELLDSESAGNA